MTPDTLSTISSINRSIVTCSRCPRLRAYCRRVARDKKREFADWTYWGKPVPGFGDPDARLLVVGLAPAAHGANRTGRMFTGDSSGTWLYEALYRHGFASQPQSRSRDDGLTLHDCYITAAARCRPTPGPRQPTPGGSGAGGWCRGLWRGGGPPRGPGAGPGAPGRAGGGVSPPPPEPPCPRAAPAGGPPFATPPQLVRSTFRW